MMASPVAGLFALEAILASPFAQNGVLANKQEKPALAEDEVKQLLLLIDVKKKGKITKQEWMKFMEAEFDRLDEQGIGELDATRLEQARLRVSLSAKADR